MSRNGSLIASHTDEIQRPAASARIEPHDGEQFWGQADPYGRPGLLVLSSSFKLLHINPEAEEILRILRLDDCRSDDWSSNWGTLPDVLKQLSEEMVGILKERIGGDDLRPIHMKRLAGELLRPVRLHGVGIPDRAGIAYARIVLSIEEVVPRCAPSIRSRHAHDGGEDLTAAK